MTTQPRPLPTDVVEARLNHLTDRSRRGALLPEEADQFAAHLRDLVRRLEDEEDTSRRLLAQRQEIAAERHAWEQRGDRAERVARSAARDAETALTARLTAEARVRELEAEVARLHEGEELRPDERTIPTPAQWLWLWNRATPTKRLEIAAAVIDDAARASRCFVGDHEGAIAHYRRRAEQAEDLLRVAHETSNQSEAERARATAEVARLTAGRAATA
ncbi:hypothetical protein [Streptomyces sp. NPDC006267]|uniref:hypothetical protein n=1 Tax=Streptomyces sp. NPDC006267 TaxID=3157173 RepID=UPI0033AECA33